MSIMHSECLSAALVIQHVKRMRRNILIILPSVACLTAPHFPTLSQKRHDFREGGGKKKLLNLKCLP